jgi:hypothetical protein
MSEQSACVARRRVQPQFSARASGAMPFVQIPAGTTAR